MKKYNLKQFMMLALLAFSLVFLSACGSEKNTDQDQNNPAKSPASSSYEEGKEIQSNSEATQPAVEAENTETNNVSPESTINTTSTTDQVLKDGIYKVDTSASKLAWSTSKIIGDPQSGLAPIKSGELIIKNGSLSGGNFIIDMSNISNDKNIEALNKHLKSDDFFAVATYPESRLTITKVEVDKEKGSYLVKANLTIKAKTAPVTFKVKLSSSNEILLATANLEIDRTIWNVRFGSGKFFENLGDKAIKNEIQYTISLQAKQ